MVSLGVVVCLALAWPAAGATGDSGRASLQDVAVRIDIEDGTLRGVCTGWIGWSEEARSAAYTAAHCYREGARYRVTLADGEAFTVFYLTRWTGADLMALWIPKGRLHALREWKPLPVGAFHALYMLSEAGAPPRLVDAAVPRVQWELRFENHPAAVAIPVHSAPGTSGAPIVDRSDGLLLGMIVGYAISRPDVSAVIPAQQIYAALAATRPWPTAARTAGDTARDTRPAAAMQIP